MRWCGSGLRRPSLTAAYRVLWKALSWCSRSGRPSSEHHSYSKVDKLCAAWRVCYIVAEERKNATKTFEDAAVDCMKTMGRTWVTIDPTALFYCPSKLRLRCETLPAKVAMEEMVVVPSGIRDSPPAAKKGLSCSVASEVADSETDARLDDSQNLITSKHRRSRQKTSRSSSREATIANGNIVTMSVALQPAASW
ncbi:hypothetical protein HPB50_019138 [Hyalomma asiaticum]|uniref:Uncharacterized protein n=1 Tax=Hyalomma asiaticum TaxID=266040 RepID=A0ACB7SG58_HYAAI|nr:hypothetical protein HPB50_019138 [Hyalomma asiaticum]